ncbi:FHA domain-containing protein [Paractinoplanes atraurantiacus]|uniref:FHA domain-containing protein n=1 Tax=Paractinoplanes atraurantiacus TaxID=1036182 RepID=UPI0015CF3A56|nr:FHA domain-containing protein [Actinoplanes atraurantiacus]
MPADQPLVVGRENSPIASQLGDYSNISRRHAEVRSDGRALTVVDLDSMNGTFVNDQRLAPNQETPVRAGDKIRFAARLEATVTGEAS